MPQDTVSAKSTDSLLHRFWRWGGVMGIILMLWPWVWAWKFTYHPSALRDVVLPVAAAAALLWMAFHNHGQPLQQRWNALANPGRKIIALLVLFFLWNLISWYFAAEPNAALMGLYRCGQLVLITSAAALLTVNEKVCGKILRALIASTAIVGAAGLIIYFIGWKQAYYAPNRMEFPFSMPAVLGGVSMVGVLGALAMLYALFIRKDNLPLEPNHAFPKKTCALGLISALLFALAGLILSGTMSSFAGLIAGLWLLGLLHLRNRRILYLATTLVLILASSFALYDFLQMPGGKAWMYSASWGIRPLYVKEALELFSKRPLLGWGPGCYAYGVQINESMGTFLHGARGGWIGAAHCEAAQVASQLGLVGITLWGAIFAGAFAACLKAIHKTRNLILLLILTGIFVDGCFSPAYYNAYDFNFLAAFILGLCISSGNKKEEQQDNPCLSDIDSQGSSNCPGGRAIKYFLPLRIFIGAGAILMVLISIQGLYSQRSLASCINALNRVASLQRQQASLISAGKNLEAEETGLQLKQQYSSAENLALIAKENATNLDLWQRAAGFHIKAIQVQSDPSRVEARLKLNWEILQRLPALSNVLHRIIEIEQELGRPGEEFTALIFALRYQPYSIPFRARLRSFLGKLDEQDFLALRDLHANQETSSYLSEKIAWLNDSDWQCLHAILLFQHNQRDRALELMSGINADAVQVLPFSSEYGALLLEAGQLSAAQEILEPACKDIPADPVALQALASALIREAAGERMGVVAPIIPGNPSYLLQFLAAALSSEEGVQKSNRSYALLYRALQRRSSFPEAALLFSQLSLLDGQPALAVKTLQDSLHIYSHNEYLHAALIQTYLHCGSDKEALAALEVARTKCPNSGLFEGLAGETK